MPLVSNALKYGEGAPVEINAEADSAGNAVVRVSDSGPGIDEHQRSRLFEKFGRAMKRDSTIAGYGLGLWIARELASLSGGSIVLGNALQRGATFVVTLPLMGNPSRGTSVETWKDTKRRSRTRPNPRQRPAESWCVHPSRDGRNRQDNTCQSNRLQSDRYG